VSIKKLTQLQHLSLRKIDTTSCKITLAHLLQLTTLTNLVVLQVSNIPVQFPGIKTLEKILPNLYIDYVVE